MANHRQAVLIFCIFLSMPLTGCIGSSIESLNLDDEILSEVEDPCSQPSQSISQSMSSVTVNGVERMFRLSVPSSD
ncbi:MAG: hypothetical protein VX892_03815, partial [Candidatus Thermoplasmatota archaeon]|nr:hypothetical protein [Candidatus Thermoplasmatota archaeon]